MVQGRESPYVRSVTHCRLASNGPRYTRRVKPDAPNQASADPTTNNSQHAQVAQVEVRTGLDVEKQDGKAQSMEMASDDTMTAEQLQEDTELGVTRVLTSMCETMLQA